MRGRKNWCDERFFYSLPFFFLGQIHLARGEEELEQKRRKEKKASKFLIKRARSF